MEEAYLGVDIGSISTKGVIIDKNYKILASDYIWTEGDPMGAARKLIELLEKQFDKEKYQIVATGTTGSARKLVGAMLGATMVKNEITAHAVGTTTLYPDVRTILEIGGQDYPCGKRRCCGLCDEYVVCSRNRFFPFKPGKASGRGSRRFRQDRSDIQTPYAVGGKMYGFCGIGSGA